MNTAVILGLLAGLAVIGVSEALLRLAGGGGARTFWRISLIGVAARTLWVAAALGAGWASGRVEMAPFTLALLAGYFAGQVIEGIRHQRVMARPTSMR